MKMKFFLIGYLFLFIYRPFEVYSILETIHLERLWMIAALCYYFFSGAVNKHRVQGSAAVVFFVSAMFLSALGAQDLERWWKTTEDFLKVAVFYFLLATSIDSEEELIDILYAYIAIMFIYEAKSLWEYFVNGRVQFRMGVSRLIGHDQSGAEPNAMAATINYSLPFAYILYLRFKDEVARLRQKRILVAYIIVSVTCIFMTGSRTGAVSLLFLAILLWFNVEHKVRWLFVFVTTALLIWNLLPYEKRVRLESIWDEDVQMEGAEGDKFMRSAKASTEGRKEGFWDGVHLLQAHPLTGAGAGNFANARQLVREIPLEQELQAHNLYGQLMGELGGFGVVAFISLLFSIIKMDLLVIRRKAQGLSPIAWACLASVPLLLINGLAAHNLYRYNWLWISAFSSVIYWLISRDDKSTVGSAA